MPDPETLVLTGGPQDGKLVTVDRWHGYYQIPIEPNLTLDPPDLYEQPRIGVYSPETDEDGHFRRNRSGHLVYLWRGNR